MLLDKLLPQCCIEVLNSIRSEPIRKEEIEISAVIRTGSSVELEGCQNCLEKFCKPTKNTVDHDLTFLIKNWLAIPQDSFYKTYNTEGYRGGIVRIWSEIARPGYTKLFRDCCGANLREESVLIGGSFAYNGKLHGPRILVHQVLEGLTDKYCEEHLNKCTKAHDVVGAVHCPYWPPEASAWINRNQLLQGRETIDLCVKYGCDFVCKSYENSKYNKNYDEFRFSFSVAERIIIESWTPQQRAVYRAIRILHKMAKEKVHKSRLRTYYFKTMMLWAVEKKPSTFWDDDGLVGSLQDLLTEMIGCLESKVCAHYFIPTNNVIAHRSDADLTEDIEELQMLAQSRSTLIKVLNCCRREEKASTEVTQKNRREVKQFVDKLKRFYEEQF